MLTTGNAMINNTTYVRQVMGSNDSELIRQVMDANSPHNPSSKGMCPFIVKEGFVSFQLPAEGGGLKAVTGIALTAINSTNFDKMDLADVINKGRFANVVMINGEITEVNVHPDLIKKIVASNAFEVLITKRDGLGFTWPKENPTIGIAAVSTNEVYHGMVRFHGFGNFIKP